MIAREQTKGGVCLCCGCRVVSLPGLRAAMEKLGMGPEACLAPAGVEATLVADLAAGRKVAQPIAARVAEAISEAFAERDERLERAGAKGSGGTRRGYVVVGK